jgi:hypothetical protein
MTNVNGPQFRHSSPPVALVASQPAGTVRRPVPDGRAPCLSRPFLRKTITQAPLEAAWSGGFRRGWLFSQLRYRGPGTDGKTVRHPAPDLLSFRATTREHRYRMRLSACGMSGRCYHGMEYRSMLEE